MKRGTKVKLLLLIGAVFVAFVLTTAYLAYVATGFIMGKIAFDKGYAAERRKEFQLAITQFTFALRNPLGAHWRAYTLENRGAAFAQLGKLKEAIQDYTAALRVKPDLTEIYRWRGFTYARDGEEELAMRDYDQVIRLEPNDADVLYYRGLSYIRAKNYPKARADFREAIRALPGYEAAYIESGRASKELGELDAAISAFDEAIRLQPADARAYYWRSRIYLQENDYRRTEADLTEAIRLAPKNLNYRIARATLYGHQQRPWQEISELTDALQVFPENETLLLTRGRIFRSVEYYDQAIDDFTELIQFTQAGAAYNERARTYFSKGNYNLALADYQQASVMGGSLESNAKPLAWFLATCPDSNYRNGDEAVAEATKDCERKDYRDSVRLDTLAAAYAESGKFNEAVSYQRQAVNLNDYNDPDWQRQLEARLDLYLRFQPYREELKRTVSEEKGWLETVLRSEKGRK